MIQKKWLATIAIAGVAAVMLIPGAAMAQNQLIPLDQKIEMKKLSFADFLESKDYKACFEGMKVFMENKKPEKIEETLSCIEIVHDKLEKESKTDSNNDKTNPEENPNAKR